MAWQLILRRECRNGTDESLFQPCRRYDVESLPFVLPTDDDGSASAVPPLPSKLSLRLDASASKANTCELHWDASADIALRLNDADAPAESPLVVRNGSCVHIGSQWQLTIYQLHGRPGICSAANALGSMAKWCIGIVLIAQLFAIVGMPLLLYYTSVFKHESQLQELSYRTDQTRKRINKLDSHDPLLSAYLDLLRSELNDRVRFLRRNGADIAPEERQAMLDNLTRLDTLLDTIQEKPVKEDVQPFDLKLDDVVKRVLKEEH